MIDLIIAALLLSASLLFAAGRHEVRRRKFRVVRSSQAGGINKYKFFGG
jgi:hypothetical protein